MNRTSIGIFTLILLGLGPCGWIHAAADPGETAYQREVLPVLTEYCFDCHSEDMRKGGIAFDKFKNYSELVKDRKFWDNVSSHVSSHVMPPEKKPKPEQRQRDQILDWIENTVMAVDPARPDPGHVTLRRLNVVEYNNTIRDVFRTSLRPADRFPADDSGHGFDNNGDVLSLPPLLMEKYLKAARSIVEDGVWARLPERFIIERSGADFTRSSGDYVEKENVYWFNSSGAAETTVEIPAEARLRLTLRLSARQSGGEKAKFEVLLDDRVLRAGEVTESYNSAAPNDHWQRFAWDQVLPGGKHKVTVRFLNDSADAGNTDPRRGKRELALESFVIQGPLRFRPMRCSPYLGDVLRGRAIAPQVLDFHGDDFEDGGGMNEFSEGGAFMTTNGSIHRAVEIPADGRYLFELSARPEQAGKEVVKLGVKIDASDMGIFEVKGKNSELQRLRFYAPLRAGMHVLQIAFLNDYYDPKMKADRNVGIERVVIEAPPSARDALSEEEWRGIVDRMALKIFRRPADETEKQRILMLIQQSVRSGAAALEALATATEAMLCSSKFLFHDNPRPGGAVESGAVPIDEFSLASRLSYFLWSSCPDDELLALASEGRLRKNQEAQVRRMLGDKKARALTENFAGQWLQLRDVLLIRPDKGTFPDFSSKLLYDMKRETEMFFENILRGNRSILEFLDSDYTFLNERLAKHYGISGVKGTDLRKTPLAGTPRGGILTQASILMLTSHPTRTSPVKRGKFLLENILGTPPPPAPQNVPPLDDGRKGRELHGTLRQRLEQHRADPSCASCHAFMDPPGFAFEHFDAVGRWRDLDNGEAIDTSGQLVTGQKFDGAEAYRKILVDQKKHDFVRSLTTNLMIYALGRGLDYSDKPFKDEIVRRTEESGHKFQEMILAVTRSVPFQMMRADDAVKNARP